MPKLMSFNEFMNHFNLNELDKIDEFFKEVYEVYRSVETQFEELNEDRAAMGMVPSTKDNYEFDPDSAREEYAYGALRLLEELQLDQTD